MPWRAVAVNQEGRFMARRGNDISTALGLLIGVGGMLAGFTLDGGSILALVGIPALIIIVSGTVGALTVSSSLRDVMRIPGLIMQSMQRVAGPSPQLAQQLLEFAEKARRDGILSLEDTVEDLEDEMLRKGLRLVVDGTESEILVEVLESDLAIMEQRKMEDATLFETAGGFSPTMGIIGTVMGLVLVLGHLGGDTNELGRAVATAFIATLYGIGLANLVWLPIGNKLKGQVKQFRLQKQLIIVGVRSIQQGESPALVKEKIEGFLEEQEKKELDANRAE
jgi:chemotaxis protein MotA